MKKKSGIRKEPAFSISEITSVQLITDLQQMLETCVGPKAAYLSKHMLSKYADPKPEFVSERRKAAIAKWLLTEQRNERTIDRLRWLELRPTKWFTDGSTNLDLLVRARRIISQTIGNHVPYRLLNGNFSGGASTSKRRQPGMVGRKFSGEQDCSKSAWTYMLPVILGSLWRNVPGALWPREVNHSILFTVPKNDTIDRVACKEPDYNMYLQKGVGDFIRHRLRKRSQIDLNDQSVNQELARTGSITGMLATVDLSSASDSVTHELVRLILPVEWFNYLDAIRVRETDVDGVRHVLRMFSSMGNGFTFELESLIFWALCSATLEICRQGNRQDVKVYGDDIVIPSQCYPVVKRTLNYFGFLVNDDKSFYKGPIRESCGKHYYLGRDITPFYIRGPLRNQVDLIHILNQLRRWSSNEEGTWCDDSTYKIWFKYARLVDQRVHGGHDFNDPTRLVAPKPGLWRFAKKRKVVTGDNLGDYISWLHDAERRRVTISLDEHEHVIELTRLFLRRVVSYPFPRNVPLYSFELSNSK